MVISRKALLVLATAALVAAGCGSQDGETAEGTSPPASPVSPSDVTDQQRPSDRVTLDLTIEGGQVDPTNEQLEAKVGQPIVVRVNSDAPDELHVHSTPEHTFQIKPEPGQQFQFTVDIPGRVEVELHDANKIVATIQVR
ncbi:hypothetical protein [Mycolicibacterium elephantis]|uniref:hypothetical protein n=1 Tax=Mycolicibacterium elephantis TaxID=81858 RepID=UPI0007EA247C|nr:hypothetical protein [Mycolicibacterium elephantis]OBA65292.1 hypothetical protein A5633_04150 [Mycolicibacterium elephantis]OBE95733.1 hypothetical protein A5776_21095 [Mycolicibacterium elephantis]